MSILGNNKLENLQFFESHIKAWSSNPPGVGLTVLKVESLAQATENARVAYDDMLEARNAAKAATTNWYALYNTMIDLGREDIRTIKAFAETQANPLAVYQLAQLPPPAAPGPAPIPGTPSNFKVELNPATGAPTIRWKCVGDGNAFYMVRRQINPPTGTIEFLGGSGGGDKFFTDTTLPFGTDSVAYFVTCQRGSVSGETASVTVRFGSSGGDIIATVNGGEAPAAKLAA